MNFFRVLYASVLLYALAFAGVTHAQSVDVQLPKLNLPNPNETKAANTPASTAEVLPLGSLRLSATLTDEGEPIESGMIWRVFNAEAEADGKLKLAAKASGGSTEILLAPGEYLVHAAFGRAGATKRVLIEDKAVEESLVMDAGGLSLNATESTGTAIAPFKLKFSIYEAEAAIDGERRLIVDGIAPGTVVRLNSGAYHIVSNYGAVNAIMRTDVRVEAGVVTEATVQHRAAEVILKLVSEKGGEALADTSWSVFTESGELLFESVGAYAPLVLAEGSYSAVAKHRERIFEREIEIKSGQNGEVEVLATF
ncbi:MAG: hypothetical protein ACRCT6_02230 [Notoacmeibacter sp.]